MLGRATVPGAGRVKRKGSMEVLGQADAEGTTLMLLEYPPIPSRPTHSLHLRLLPPPWMKSE